MKSVKRKKVNKRLKEVERYGESPPLGRSVRFLTDLLSDGEAGDGGGGG